MFFRKPKLSGQVCDILASVCELKPSSITMKATLLDLGVDSVRTLEILAAIEQETGVALSPLDPEVARLRTVAQLVELVDQRRLTPKS